MFSSHRSKSQGVPSGAPIPITNHYTISLRATHGLLTEQMYCREAYWYSLLPLSVCVYSVFIDDILENNIFRQNIYPTDKQPGEE